MAGLSSKVGYLNIGIAETSSHPEIEPVIEDVEATGDSNEVCGLERKECDEIMEHLKNNPGLVVKSLGSEGQIVLHVAVIANETKKSKSPASKCTNNELREAASDSDWFRALENKDCKKLMALLEANPCLVAQTGREGRTVLHAAAERGCVDLLYQVSNLLPDSNDKVFGMKVDLSDLFLAKYGPSKAEAQNMAWFTIPRDVWNFTLHPYFLEHPLNEKYERSSSGTSQHLRDKILEIMEGELAKKDFDLMEERYKEVLDYNFVFERKELQFHFACGVIYFKYLLDRNLEENYVKTIIHGCLELGPPESVEVLTYLFQLHNAQGQTPLHLAVRHGRIAQHLELLPLGDAYRKCLNARDVKGWTILHCCAATKNHHQLKILLTDERIFANIRTYIPDGDCEEVGMTALHLAILHNDVKSVELLLDCSRTDVNALLYRPIVCGYERTRADYDYEKLQKRTYWSPLQLAVIMGLSDVVRALLKSEKVCNIYDDKKLQNNNNMGKNFQKVSPLLLASASGNPDTLGIFLDHLMFDPLVKSEEGATALHYATNAMIPTAEKMSYFEFRHYKVGPILYFSDLAMLYQDTRRYEEELEDIELTPTSYLRRQACITMLLQAGVDIWEKDNLNRLAEPGPQAPKEAHLWWHEQMARETLEAKKSLNDAANAISVVAALVATASFVGPLQPPLGYGGDSIEGRVQDTHMSVRVFMVSNILSFYFAVASIMFAVVPSLPMPQEGIYAEWRRTRRSVGVAIFFLLMSVLSVLISFGTASNSVISEDYSWQHAGLSFYPTLLGGFICILGISLFFIRLLRLVFHRNVKIRSLYKTFVKF